MLLEPLRLGGSDNRGLYLQSYLVRLHIKATWSGGHTQGLPGCEGISGMQSGMTRMVRQADVILAGEGLVIL